MYSLCTRKKILEIRKKERVSIRKIAKRFAISPHTVFKWSKNIEPKYKRNRGAIKIDMELLKEDVISNPDLYQYERAKCLKVAQSTVHYALRRLAVSYKKNSKTSKSRRREAYIISNEN